MDDNGYECNTNESSAWSWNSSLELLIPITVDEAVVRSSFDDRVGLRFLQLQRGDAQRIGKSSTFGCHPILIPPGALCDRPLFVPEHGERRLAQDSEGAQKTDGHGEDHGCGDPRQQDLRLERPGQIKQAREHGP